MRLGGLVGNAGVDVNEFSYNINEVALNELSSEDNDKSARGSWQLLADQNNRASWSPLHLICVQGGFTHGKVSLLKALLQMNNDDDRHHQGTFTTTSTATSSPARWWLSSRKLRIYQHVKGPFIPNNNI